MFLHKKTSVTETLASLDFKGELTFQYKQTSVDTICEKLLL